MSLMLRRQVNIKRQSHLMTALSRLSTEIETLKDESANGLWKKIDILDVLGPKPSPGPAAKANRHGNVQAIISCYDNCRRELKALFISDLSEIKAH